MRQGYITMLSIGHYGRFCNMLYQIAGVIGVGLRNNLEPVFPPFVNHDHVDRFSSSEDIDLQKYFEHKLPGIPEGIEWQPERPQAWGYHDVNLGPGNWNISGHFQSTRYFDHCIDTVKHYFRMKNETPEIQDRVAIHLRAQDYDHDSNLGWHPVLKESYYKPAMELFPDAKFLVFSDDLDKARILFGDSVEYSERDYVQDFKLMKRCRHFIIGNSSYSAMAAVLGDAPDKRVVAPRPWFGAAAGIHGEDIYGSDWQVVNWQ